MFKPPSPLKCLLVIVLLAAALSADCHAEDVDFTQAGDWAQINLTDAQLEWLGRHNVLRLGVGVRFYPIMFVEQDDGKPEFAGMVADYVRLFEKRLGVTMSPVLGVSFKEALELGRRGEIDLFPCVSETPDRADFLIYTKPYLVFPLVIITRNDFGHVSGLKDLAGKRIAVIKELSTYGLLRQDYPNFNFVFEKDFVAAFTSVSVGRTDAFVCNLAVASHYIQKMGLLNLKVAAPASVIGDELTVGVRKDMPVLRDIMSKVVASVTPEEHSRIRGKWITIRYEQGMDWGLISEVSIIVVLVVVLVLVMVLTWNKRLTKEVQARKAAEEKAKEDEFRLRTLINAMPDIVCFKDGEGRWQEANKFIRDLFLISDVDYRGKTDLDLISYSPFFREALEACDASDLEAWRSGGPLRFEEQIQVMNGPPKVIEFIKVPTYHPDGQNKGMIIVGRDVTARKKTEDSLRDSEERYRKTFESISDAISITRFSDGQYLFINDGFTRQTGWLGREILGKSVFNLDIFHDLADRQRMLKILESGGDILNMDMLLRRKNGEPYYATVSAKLLDYGGEKCIIAQLRDVTVRVEAVRALAKSEETYRNIVDNSPLGIYQSLPGGRYRMVNPAFANMMGFESPEQMVREVKDISTLYMDPQDRLRFIEHLDRHNGAVDYELHCRRRDGSQMWMTTFTKVVRDENGEFAYLDGFALDITDRKLANAAAEESREQFEAIFEQAAVGINHVDPDGRIIRANKRLCEMWGYEKNELIGRQLFELIHPDDRDMSMGFAGQLLTGKISSYALQDRNLRKDGSVIWVNVTASMVRDNNGEPKYAVGVVEDITDKKRAEDEKAELELQLRQSKKMQAIGTLAGGVAHDFNNILATIMGYSELALSMLKEDKLCANEVSEILRASERAKELVQQILTFSRKVEVDLKAIDLNQEIDHCARILDRTLPKMIDLKTILDEELPQIKADATQIEQVLLNLATNAADAMPEGGKLIVETSEVFLDPEYCRRHLEISPGHYVLLQVSDTGCGMDEQTRQQVFDPFFTTKEVGKGTGLGLSTVFGIVKEHGGHIHCYSEMGRGTIFKIYLPADGEAPEAAEAAEATETPTPAEPMAEQAEPVSTLAGNETILFVDDEQALRKLGRSMLGDAGYQVLTAKSGEEALEIYAQNPSAIDLTILDLSMPGMGGHKCLVRLLELNPEAKVIIASGYSANATAKDTIDAGAVGFISKPFRGEELLTRIRQAIDKA